jgi:hypothetical protein
MINFKIFAATVFISSSASAGIVTFDNLPPVPTPDSAGQRLMVPVDGFSFTTSGTYPNAWFYYNPNNYTNNYMPAMNIGVRGTTAIFSGWYNTAYPTYSVSRTDGSLWQFNKAFFTAMYGAGVIHLIGLRNGIEIFNFTQSISNTQQTMVSMSSYPGPVNWIDTLNITNDLPGEYGNRYFIMDDMYYTLPAPGAFALMGCGLIGFRTRRR